MLLSSQTMTRIRIRTPHSNEPALLSPSSIRRANNILRVQEADGS